MAEPALSKSTFWQEVVRFQRDAVRPWIGIRNATGVALPLAVAAALGSLSSGLVMATGALNVAFSDSHLPYGLRGRRMLAASLVVGVGVIAGASCGWNK